jgi:hypothetical protein
MNVNTWIEGNGTVRTMFRKLALYKYGTLELSKLQLINAVEKENQPLITLTIQYAIDRRKNEIQWVSLYMPLMVLMTFSLPVFNIAFAIHNMGHLP